MQSIKKRPRLDTLKNQERASPIRWGRRVYLGLLALLGLFLVDYAVGDAVLLRADGIVATDRQIVAAVYPAKVSAVRVREGEVVEAGAVLVQLESADMLKDIADLAARNADLAVRETQLTVRARTVKELLPLAERHARENTEQVTRIDTMATRGLVSSQRMDQVLSSGYDTVARVTELRAQALGLGGELELISRAHKRADEALNQLEAFYDRGVLRAAAAGTVGPRVPTPGQVVKFGDELLQLNGKKAYVLAYLPDIYLFGMQPGDRLEVSNGTSRAIAEVDAILTVADALPAEFQNMFRPRDRSRLVRLSLPREHGFAISQKVRVRGCAFGYCWRGSKV
jgi:multidrug resistance efflux pump